MDLLLYGKERRGLDSDYALECIIDGSQWLTLDSVGINPMHGRHKSLVQVFRCANISVNSASGSSYSLLNEWLVCSNQGSGICTKSVVYEMLLTEFPFDR